MKDKIKEFMYDMKILKYFFYDKDRFIKRLTKFHSKKSFLTYHIRPKKTDNLIDDSIRIKNRLGKVGIVIQGPLKLEDNFTYETIKYYKKIYKDCEIILSTWNDENKEEIEKIKKLGVNVIENEKPQHGGYANLNYQIVSTRNGIKFAIAKECQYILKTRTDVRIYEAEIDKFLISLLEIFPTKNKFQNKRVITIDINMNQYYLCMSDIFQFGTTEEMDKVWDIPLYSEEITIKKFNKLIENLNFEEENKLLSSERFILKNYIEKLGINYEVSLKNYYKILKENFIVIDTGMINMFWYKYNRDEYQNRKDYSRKILDSYINFSDWVTIYNNDVDVRDLEKLFTKTRKELEALTIEDILEEK